MMVMDQIRPNAIEADHHRITEIQNLANSLGVKRRRIYGLAVEYAMQEDSDFETFVKNNA